MRLIDADAFDKCLEDAEDKAIHMQKYVFASALNTIRGNLRTFPAIEPEREKGHWQIEDAYPHNVFCSECHARFAQTHWAVWKDGSLPRRFCPNCGADMRGGEDG
jgi:hypothetical protein